MVEEERQQIILNRTFLEKNAGWLNLSLKRKLNGPKVSNIASLPSVLALLLLSPSIILLLCISYQSAKIPITILFFSSPLLLSL